MPEGTQIGAFYWKLGIFADGLRRDLQLAKEEVNKFEKETDSAGDSTKQFSQQAVNAKVNTILFGTSLLAAGTAMSTGATALSRLNLISSDTADYMRVAATGIDSLSAAVMNWGQLQTFANMLKGKVATALIDVAIAATTATGALTLLAGATVIGAVIVAAYLLYQEFERAASGARTLEREISQLSRTIEDSDTILGIYKEQFTDAEKEVKGYESALKSLDDKIKDVNKDLERSIEVEDELRHIGLDLNDIDLERKEAKRDLGEAAKKTDDPFAVKEVRNRIARIDERERDLRKREADLTKEKATLSTPSDLTTLQKEREATFAGLVTAKRETTKLTEKITAEEYKNRYDTALQEYKKMQQEGTPISLQRHRGIQGTPEGDALAAMPRTVLKEPDIPGFLEAFKKGGIGLPGGYISAAQFAAAGGLTARTERNPLFSEMDNSIHIQNLHIGSAEEVPVILNTFRQSQADNSQKNRIDLARNGVSLGW